jgi:hypothetical protein
MPHILSSNALDLLFNLELSGKARPVHEILFDGPIVPGSGITIIRNAAQLGPSYGILVNPVMFVALLKITQDPLLGSIEYKYTFLSPFNEMDNIITGRVATQILPTFFLPMSQFEIDLTASTTQSAGVTVAAIYDLLSNETAQLFAQIGDAQVVDVENELNQLILARTTPGGAPPNSGSQVPIMTSGEIRSVVAPGAGTIPTRSIKISGVLIRTSGQNVLQDNQGRGRIVQRRR